jgi:hypothetical protein
MAVASQLLEHRGKGMTVRKGTCSAFNGCLAFQRRLLALESGDMDHQDISGVSGMGSMFVRGSFRFPVGTKIFVTCYITPFISYCMYSFLWFMLSLSAWSHSPRPYTLGLCHFCLPP